MSSPSRRAILAAVLFAACSSPTATHPGPEIQIPVFAADDARVGKAGFVGETLRLHKEVDGVRYTLMAFAVGDTLTLGAMVKGGPFAGTVQWRLGDRTLSTPFDASQPAKAAEVSVSGGATPLVAHGAGFRGTSWMNVELPLAAWLRDGDALQLVFTPGNGPVLTLPDAGVVYVARFGKR